MTKLTLPVLLSFLTIVQVNYAWNDGKSSGQGQIPRPFWKSPAKLNRGQYQQQTSSYQQDEASAEPAPVIPQTSFTCDGKPYQPGMYADTETECRVYHVCVEERKESFFCGEGTVFNQKILTCDYPKDTDCARSQSYWSANEELGKPGAEPSPIQAPVSPAQKTRQPFKGISRPQQQVIPQRPSKQYQPQQQQQYLPRQQQYQPQQPYQPQNTYEDNGFVDEPVKKIRPSYKVIKTQQQVTTTDRRGFSGNVNVQPTKKQFFQEPVPLDVAGPADAGNYKRQSYQQSHSYFSQQQTSGQGWQPSSGPVRQTSETQFFSGQQQPQPHSPPQKSHRQQPFGQQYSQQSDTSSGWRATDQIGGGHSLSDLSESNVDLNIPQTNFDCEGKPYEPGMYADTETECRIYHVCFDGRKESFACGKGTAFNQKLLTCDHIRAFKCADTPRFYSVNENLINDQGTWTLRQASNQQRYSGGDGWSNQRKIKK